MRATSTVPGGAYVVSGGGEDTLVCSLVAPGARTVSTGETATTPPGTVRTAAEMTFQSASETTLALPCRMDFSGASAKSASLIATRVERLLEEPDLT